MKPTMLYSAKFLLLCGFPSDTCPRLTNVPVSRICVVSDAGSQHSKLNDSSARAFALLHRNGETAGST